VVAPIGAQGRPDLSGRWVVAADRGSTPESMAALGSTVTISQSANSITIEGTVIWFRFGSRTADAQGGPREREITRPIAYTVDGVERELPQPLTAVPDRRARSASVTPTSRTYLAAWTGPRLVIMTRDAVQLTRGNEPPYLVKRVIRRALSIDAEGSLIVDSLLVSDPIPEAFFFGAPARQDSPVPIRTVYRKAS
jgi:hypothetical protein